MREADSNQSMLGFRVIEQRNGILLEKGTLLSSIQNRQKIEGFSDFLLLCISLTTIEMRQGSFLII